MKKSPVVWMLCFVLFLPLIGWSEASAFDISGTLKTLEKNDDREIQRPRGDVQIEEESKILEINLRRTNPTVSGDVTVQWVVVMKDTRGRLRPATLGEKTVSLAVGIPAKLESDAFSVMSADFDLNNRGRNDGGKMEQEVAGYAILILNDSGEEVGAKFQPGSLEEKGRDLLTDPSPNPRKR